MIKRFARQRQRSEYRHHNPRVSPRGLHTLGRKTRPLEAGLREIHRQSNITWV